MKAKGRSRKKNIEKFLNIKREKMIEVKIS